MTASLAAVRSETPFVEAPDEASHQGDVAEKVKAISLRLYTEASQYAATRSTARRNCCGSSIHYLCIETRALA